jgi:hypothetical protein
MKYQTRPLGKIKNRNTAYLGLLKDKAELAWTPLKAYKMKVSINQPLG